MNILLLANHCDTGGVTSYLITLARGLIERGHGVYVASEAGDRVEELNAMGARFIRVPLRVKCEIHPQVFISAVSLLKTIRKEKIDMIHTHTRTTQLCARILSCLTQVPFISTCHGFFNPHIGRILFPFWGQGVIAISSPVREHLIKDLGVKAENISLIRNGIEVDRFHPLDKVLREEGRRKFGCQSGPVVGMVARLSDVKGHACLIKAMSEIVRAFPDVTCLIVGTGPLESSLKDLVRQKNLEGSVVFHPIINKPAEILPLCDVVVIPSVQEGIGLLAMEAGACGVAVVASDVGGLPEVVLDGETGMLFPSGDAKTLASSIIALLRDPIKRAAMGQRAREVVRERFSSQRMVNATEELYIRVLKSMKPNSQGIRCFILCFVSCVLCLTSGVRYA